MKTRHLLVRFLSLICALSLFLPASAFAAEAPQGLGGYIENILTLPEAYSNNTAPAFAPDGSFSVAARHAETGQWDLLTWRESGAEPEILPLTYDGAGISGISFAPDGQLMGYTDGTLMDFSQAETETDDPSSEPQIVYSPDMFVSKLHWFNADGTISLSHEIKGILRQVIALENGAFLIRSSDGVLTLYDAQGKEQKRYDAQNIGTIAIGKDAVYGISFDRILVLDLGTLEKQREIQVSLGYSAVGAIAADGSLLVIDEQGIYQLAPGGETLTLMHETMGFLIGDPNNELRGLGILPDGTLIAAMAEGAGGTGGMSYSGGQEEITLLSYLYSETLDLSKREPFTITALRDSARLRKTVGDFQRQHPELKVVLNTMLAAEDVSPVDDAIRKLNTELLAGKGGDVLILDELPLEKYIQRGLLKDLTEVIADIDFLPGIRAGSASADGKVYAMPAQFTFDTLWGTSSMTEAIHRIADLSQLPLEQGQTAIYPRNPEDLLRLFYPLSEASFRDETGQLRFDTPTFEAFLETLYDLYMAQGDSPADADISTGMGGISQQEMQGVLNAATPLLPTNVSSLQTLAIPYSLAGAGDGAYALMPTFAGDQAVYKPSLLAGIYANSEKTEQAAAFLQLLFSKEIQEIDNMEGLPTLASALDAQIQGVLEFSKQGGVSMISFGEGNPLLLQQPDENTWNALRETCNKLSMPAFVDETLLQFLTEETASYFQGAISAADAASAMQQRAWPYLNE